MGTWSEDYELVLEHSDKHLVRAAKESLVAAGVPALVVEDSIEDSTQVSRDFVKPGMKDAAQRVLEELRASGDLEWMQRTGTLPEASAPAAGQDKKLSSFAWLFVVLALAAALAGWYVMHP